MVVGNSNRRVKIRPQITGGGQQNSLRSGTVNPAGAVGIAAALQLCVMNMTESNENSHELRRSLFEQLAAAIDGLEINGPELESEHRLAGNLNMILPAIEGSAWMSATPEVAFSSGSACSSVEAKPSHVLTGIGVDESQARRSVRFGVGRFNTQSEIDHAAGQLIASYQQVAKLG